MGKNIQLLHSGSFPAAYWLANYSTLVQQTSPSNLVAYYPLDETAGATSVTSLKQAAANVIVNGGFEYYTGTAFESVDSIKGAPAIVQEAVDIHSGSFAIKFNTDAQYWQCYADFTFNGVKQFAAVPGVYTIKFWTHGDGTHAGAYYVLDVTHTAYLIPATDTGVTGLAYQQIVNTFTVPAGCTSFIVRVMGQVNGDHVFFDDLEVIAPASVNPFIGKPTAVTFGQTGIGDGRTAVRIGGVNGSQISLNRTAWVNCFSYSVGTLMIWFRYIQLADCEGGEGTQQTLYSFVGKLVDGHRDVIMMEKDVEANTEIFAQSYYYTPRELEEDSQHIEYYQPFSTSWHCLAMTYNGPAGRMCLYHDGAMPTVYQNPYSMNPDGIETPFIRPPYYPAIEPVLGAYMGIRVWKGDLAHFAHWDCELSQTQIRHLALRA